MMTFRQFTFEANINAPKKIAKRLCQLIDKCVIYKSNKYSSKNKNSIVKIKNSALKMRIRTEISEAMGNMTEALLEVAGTSELNGMEIIKFLKVMVTSKYNRPQSFIILFKELENVLEHLRIVLAQIELDISVRPRITRKTYEKRVQRFNRAAEKINEFINKLIQIIVDFQKNMGVSLEKCSSFAFVSKIVIDTFQKKDQLKYIYYPGVILEDESVYL